MYFEKYLKNIFLWAVDKKVNKCIILDDSTRQRVELLKWANFFVQDKKFGCKIVQLFLVCIRLNSVIKIGTRYLHYT